MKFTRLCGTGSYLPPDIVTNTDLEQRVDTSAQWILERTGVEQRHIARSETTCDLAEQAARQALAAAHWAPESLDMVIVATTTPDHIFPSVASQLQHRLGCYGGAAFDVQAVCTGFVYALAIADPFIRTGVARRILVVGAETFSRIVDWTDRSTCILFGDGAGAVVVEAAESPGILSCHLHADGRYKELLWVPSPGDAKTRPYVQMRGSEVFKVAVNTLERATREALEAHQMSVDDIDWLIPHQANERILIATAKKLGLPTERVICTVRTHANTSAASVPLAFDVAVRDGRIQRGDTVLLVAFGGGFTWGAIALHY